MSPSFLCATKKSTYKIYSFCFTFCIFNDYILFVEQMRTYIRALLKRVVFSLCVHQLWHRCARVVSCFLCERLELFESLLHFVLLTLCGVILVVFVYVNSFRVAT
uniref:Uncharacterized protein n=1 Tax=Rhipicephalus microplus TaxID=6941 RepID=A0A6G5AIH7_RHIMP